MKTTKNINYEQIDLFANDNLEDFADLQEEDNYFDPWDATRGRNIIKAQGKDGKDITLYFDSLDQMYHLFDE